MQRDAFASGKGGSAPDLTKLGVRQYQTLRPKPGEGRICTMTGAKALGRIPDTTGDPSLGPVTNALLQNGST